MGTSGRRQPRRLPPLPVHVQPHPEPGSCLQPRAPLHLRIQAALSSLRRPLSGGTPGRERRAGQHPRWTAAGCAFRTLSGSASTTGGGGLDQGEVQRPQRPSQRPHSESAEQGQPSELPRGAEGLVLDSQAPLRTQRAGGQVSSTGCSQSQPRARAWRA